MKKNLYFLIISLLVLALIIIVPCFMNNNIFTNLEKSLLYFIPKIIWGLLFAGVVLYLFFKPFGKGLASTLYGITLLYQLLPLLVRIIIKQKNATVLVIILLIVSLIIYFALFAGITSMSKKMLESEEKYKGHSLDIEE